MSGIRFVRVVVAVWLSALVACASPPGRPHGAETRAPHEVTDFDTLYAENCAGCHGAEGRGGAAIALADPVYLGIAGDSVIRTVIATGVAGTSMPAFAQSAGGMLTNEQVDAIAGGMRSRWSKPGLLDGANPPPYAPQSVGNARDGEAAYDRHCSACHGAGGRGGPKGSAITHDAFLALVSDQGLRTTIIAGRPELGAPDWRGNAQGRPMTDQEITDVVAWLASHRLAAPGQPYPAPASTQR